MYVNILKSQVEEEDNIEKGEEEARELRRKSEEYGITEIKGRKNPSVVSWMVDLQKICPHPNP